MSLYETRLFAAGWAILVPGLLITTPGAAEPVVAYAPHVLESSNVDLTPKNTPRRDVLARLGPPDATLSPDIWIYWNYRGGRQQPAYLDTLVVTFQRDRIAGLKLTSSETMRACLAELAMRSPATALRQPLYMARSPSR